MMELCLHITGEENYSIEISQEKRNETYSYRVLKIRTENYQKQITLFLSDAQARQIAETILAGLGVEAEDYEGGKPCYERKGKN